MQNKILKNLYLIAASVLVITSPLLTAASAEQENTSVATDKNSPGIAVFTPPKGWRAAQKKDLSPHVKIFVIGPKLQNEMPPTMNLMIEPYNGTLKSYLKDVKKINDAHGDAWKDLGALKTKAGEANLSQVEMRSKWGGEKLMHAIIVKNGYAYVLTATAAKNEFGRFYQQFYSALRSLQIYDHVHDLVTTAEKRESLENAYATIRNAFEQALQKQAPVPSLENSSKEQLFQSTDFQNNYWKPFEGMLQRDYGDLGEDWQNAVLIDLQESLMNN